MVIKNETQNYLTIETTKEDATFLFNALNIGIQSIQLDNETRLRMINFTKELGERLGIINN